MTRRKIKKHFYRCPIAERVPAPNTSALYSGFPERAHLTRVPSLDEQELNLEWENPVGFDDDTLKINLSYPSLFDDPERS